MPDEPGGAANPLHERYASADMAELFSSRHRHLLWRQMWITLARCQAELGLPVTPEQLAALEAAAPRLDLARASEIEAETRHDVVAHLRHFAEQAGEAGAILHLGATSAFVTDNAEAVVVREALALLERRLAAVAGHLGAFARRHRDVPTLAYTHLQPAQLTTVGKRACLWLQDFWLDLGELRRLSRGLLCRGVKGTTGTQASFLELFDGDDAKVVELDRRFAARLGFAGSWPITGQTYPRKQDAWLLAALAGVAASAHKMGSDVRLLQGLGVLAEPFGSAQVGSSAMPYKRNPMRSERMCALARRLLTDSLNGPLTAATQWLERSLDDSANRRLVLPDAFLTADAVLLLAANIAAGLELRQAANAALVRRELPFMATETILARATRAGGDRQELHERLRRLSLAAHAAVERGEENPLLDAVAADGAFGLTRAALDELARPEAFTGRAPRQVDEFLAAVPEAAAPPREPAALRV